MWELQCDAVDVVIGMVSWKHSNSRKILLILANREHDHKILNFLSFLAKAAMERSCFKYFISIKYLVYVQGCYNSTVPCLKNRTPTLFWHNFAKTSWLRIIFDREYQEAITY